MKVLFAASEVVPFAKTGGLADVAGSLPKALSNSDVDVRVVMPKYKSIPQKYVDQMMYIGYVYVNVGWRHQFCAIMKLELDGVIYYFIDNEYYFKRDYLYGHNDEAEQFTFFSRAILEILPAIDFKPDIIHCNDWQTGIVPLLLKVQYKHLDFYREIKTIFTIHNLKYQGVFPKDIITSVVGLGWEYFTQDGLEFFDAVNFMKAGLLFADIITTVSKTYAEEIKYDFFGENLNGVIHRRSSDLYGIVNGIDFVENDPATDKRLFANFDAKDIKGKKVNKQKLQESLGLPVRDDVPLIGIISRLVDQKGFDLIDHVFGEIMNLDVQVVVLGTGEYRYENMFKHYAYIYPEKMAARITYDGLLAQRIYASSDLFLMPSLFEPCGLSQLFSLRYGTLPIVRETGGLKDTVIPYDPKTDEGYGFTFTNYNAHDMLQTVENAVELYKDKKVWDKLVKRGMSLDFSWDKSAHEYIALYDKAMKK